MTRKHQIKWLINQYFDNELQSLCATDSILEDLFVKSTGAELSHDLWCERIRSAAKEIGLSPKRLYNFDGGYGSGIPRFSTVYT